MVGDVEVGGAAFEVPDAGAGFFDQVLVVGDEEDGAFVLLDGLVEGVDALEVEVVRGFVEDEDVGLLQHDLAEEQTGGFASGECVGLLEAFFAVEEHLAEDAADVFLGGLRVELVEPVAGRHAELDGALVVLGEVADLDLVAPFDGAGVDGDVLLFDAGAVGEQRFEERGLALAVAADEDDLVAALDGGGEVVDDVLGLAVLLLVGLVDVLRTRGRSCRRDAPS